MLCGADPIGKGCPLLQAVTEGGPVLLAVAHIAVAVELAQLVSWSCMGNLASGGIPTFLTCG